MGLLRFFKKKEQIRRASDVKNGTSKEDVFKMNIE